MVKYKQLWVLLAVLHQAVYTWQVELPTFSLGCAPYPSIQDGASTPGYGGNMTIDDCRVNCYEQQRLFSGIYNAKVCLCLQSFNESMAPGVCDLECPVQDVEKCGGQGSVSIYSQPRFLENFTIELQDDKNVIAFEEVEVSTRFDNNGTLFMRDIDFGDGLIESCNTPSCLNITRVHPFHLVGQAYVTSTASDTEERNASAYKVVQIIPRLGSVKITEIPQHVADTEEFSFEVHVDSGYGIQLDLDFGDGTTINMSLGDSGLYHVGTSIDKVISSANLPNKASKVYLMVNRIFKYNGLVRGWDFNVRSPGLLHFQVFRPLCTYGFCMRSYSCLPWGVACDRNQTNFWAATCSTPSVWILSSQKCNGTDENIYMPTEFADMPLKDFRYVGENSFEATETGFQRITVSVEDAIRVQPGDIMAIVQDRGILEVLDKSQTYEFSHEFGSDWSRRTEFNYTMVLSSANYTGMAYDHHLSATVERTVVTKLEHTYDIVNMYNMTASIESSFTNETYSNVLEIDCQQRVENMTIDTFPYGTTNVSHDFDVFYHPGNRHFYNWTFGDGFELYYLTNATTNHTYDKEGVYEVTVTSWNDVTMWTNTTYVIIQDSIQNFTLTARYNATIYGTSTHVDFTIDQGTNVTYLVDMGDGKEFEIHAIDGDFQFLGATVNATNKTTDEMLLYNTPLTELNATGNATELEGSFDYVYADIGNYTMSVTVYNLISNLTINETFLPIQVPLRNLSIVDIEPIPFHDLQDIYILLGTGSAVSFASEFDGNSTRIFNMDEFGPGNITLEEQDYLVTGPHNLSVTAWNLVPPYLISDNFTVWVEYIITDVEIVLNTSHVRPYEAILFNVTMANGSRIDVILDYDHDNVSDYEYRYDMLEGDLIQFEHEFVDVRFYNVCLSVTNAVSNYTVCVPVTVQHPVAFLNVTTDSPVVIPPVGLGNMLFTIFYEGNYPDDPLPTDAFFLYTYGDYNNEGHYLNNSLGMSFGVNGSVDNVTTMYGYSEFDTYNVSCNISNFVSHMYWEWTVVVDQPVQGLQIVQDVQYVCINENSTVTVTMDWGSRLGLQYNFRDDTPFVYAPYDPLGVNSELHTFNKVGVFDVEVTTNNSVGIVSQTLEYPVIVQKPIYEFMISSNVNSSLMEAPTWAVEMDFEVYMDMSYDFPTNVSYIIDFGDGSKTSVEGEDLPAGNITCEPSCEGLLSNESLTCDETVCLNANGSMVCNETICQHFILSVKHTYMVGDGYSVQLLLQNLVSDAMFNFNHSIYENIVQLQIAHVNEQAADLTLKAGSISMFNGVDEYFPLESDLLFEVEYYRGSLITFTWDFGDGHVESVYNEKSIVHKYDNPGTYHIVVMAVNMLSETNATRTVIVQRSGVGSTIFTTTPRSRNISIPFKVDAGTSIGTDACMFIDFKDPASLDGHLLFLGNRTQCDISFAGEISSEYARFESYSAADFENIQAASPTNEASATVYNNYQNIGTYLITMTVVNQVSMLSTTLYIGITRGPCSWPKVDLQGPNTCNVPFCDDRGFLEVYRSARLQVKSSVELNCKSTKIAHYNWNVFSVDDTSLEETPYDMGAVQTYSTALTTLIVPKKHLPYGLYRFYLNVSMDQEIGIETIDMVYVRIIKTPLAGEIGGGLTRRKQWGSALDFDAFGPGTFDPDVEDTTDPTGFTFTWMCRRKCESFPKYNDDFTEELEPFNTTCEYFSPTGDIGGCSTADSYNSSGIMANNTWNVFALDLYYTYERDKLEIVVIIKKDTREVRVSQFLEITDGPSPETEIVCKSNCRKKDNKNKLNPDMKVSLQSVVTGGRNGVAYVYLWSLMVSEKTESIMDSVLIPAEVWSNDTSTGLESPNLGIKAFFFTNPDDTNKKFYLSVRVYRMGSNPDNYGESTLEFTINKPPFVGKGAITPSNGTALETMFNTYCEEEFIDEDLPLTFRIGYRKHGDEGYKWIHSGPCEMLTAKILPAGNVDDDYWIQFIFVATDAIGSSSSMETAGCYVYDPPDAAVNDLVDSIANGESSMEDMAASGNIAALASTCTAIGNTLNSGPSNNGVTETPQASNGGNARRRRRSINSFNVTSNATQLTAEELAAIEQAKQEAQTQARSQMVSAMQTVPMSDVSEIASLASALTECLGDSSQLSGDAQTSGSAATDNTIKTLGDNMDDLESSEAEAVAGNILNIMGNSANALADTKDSTDFSGGASTDGTTTMATTKESQSKNLRDSLMKQTDELSGFMSGKKVEGEGPSVISSPGLALVVQKEYPDKLAGGSLDAQGGSGLTMPVDNSMFGSGNSTASSVTASVTRVTKNPFPSQSGNETINVDGNIIMLGMTDDTGGSVEGGNTSDPTHIMISRDAAEVKLDYIVNRTFDSDFMVMHKIVIPGNSSLHINIMQTTQPKNITNDTTTAAPMENFSTTTLGPVTSISYMSSTMSTTVNIPTTAQLSATSWRTTTAPPNITIGATTGRPLTRDPNSPTGVTTMSPFTTPPRRNVSLSSQNITNEYWTTNPPGTTTPMTTTTTEQTTTTNPPTQPTTEPIIVSEDDIYKTLPKTKFTIYVGLDFIPTLTNYSFNCTLPFEPIVEEVEVPLATTSTTGAPGNSTDYTTTTEPPTAKTPTGPAGTPDMDTCFRSNMDVNRHGMVTVYFGIKSVKPNISESETTTNLFETTTAPTEFNSTSSENNTTATLSRRRRSVANTTSASNNTSDSTTTAFLPTEEPFDPFAGPTYYKVVAYAAQCKYFSPWTQQWETDGCQVGPLTTPYKTHCICDFVSPPKPPGYVDPVTTTTASPTSTTADPNMVPPPVKAQPAAFGAAFMVPVNTINPSDSAFLKLDSNPVIFSVMVALICLYLTTLIWAKKADKMDELKASSSPLLDNDPRHKYLYELTIYTGSKSRAGTTAKVSMVFSGDDGETDPRLIYDDKRLVLQKGGVDSFVMAEAECLGQLAHVRIWHDNSGKNPSWFFSRMQVRDLQTGEKYFFICDKWLAVEEDEGLIDRVIPLAGRDELTNFNHLFWTKTKKDLTDGHLWFSVFGRPAKSRFTRCQRLTCCISLLFCTMMANILFYQTDDGGVPQQVLEIGPISLSPAQILTGIYSSLIVFPINLAVVMIFRYSRAPKKKLPKPKKSVAVFKGDEQPMDAEKELQLQVEFLETGNAEKRLLKTPLPRSTPVPPDARSLKSPVQISTISLRQDDDEVMTVDYEDDSTTRSKKKKKKFLLPHGFIYLGYFLCLATCGAAFYVTVEIGGVFGAKKSNEWMVSFVVSIIESIFFTQPVKVLGLAIFYSLVIKKPDVEEDEEDIDDAKEEGLQKGEEYLHKHHKKADSKWKKAMAKMKAQPMPPDEEYLKACRELRFKEMQMQAIIMEIIVYLFFLYLLLMVGYGNRDPWSNIFYNNVKNMVNSGHYSSSVTPFSAVTNYKQFWAWTNKTFIDGIYPDVWYNDKNYWFSDGFTQDRNNYLLGSPRLRVLRMPSTNCTLTMIDFPNGCREAYSMTDEDEGKYRKKWIPVNTSDVNDVADDNWYWKNSSALDGYPTSGLLATYGGGGFTANLGTTKQEARAVLQDLKENDWLDKHTRAVFVEFVLYNPQLNLHGVSFLLFEILPTGAIYPMYKFYIMRLDQTGANMLTVLVAEFLTVCFTIFYMVREIKKIKKEGKYYFRDFWNKVEFVVTCFMIAAVVMFFYRFILSIQLMDRYRTDPTAFVNFQWTAGWDEIFGYLVAFIVFVATLKCLKLLRFNKKMSMLGRTLALAAGPITSFLVVFGVVFFAYAIATFLIFGRTLVAFSSFITACETLFSMMLNKFDYNELARANPVFAPIIFLSFVIFVTFMLLNFFLTMIIDAFSVVKWETRREKNEFEIVDFMVSRFKSLFGVGNGGRLNPLGDGDDGFVDDSSNELKLKIEGMLEWFVEYYNVEEESAEEMDKLRRKQKKMAREDGGKFIYQTD